MKRFGVGTKLVLFQNVYYVIFYVLVILLIYMLYYCDQEQMEQVKKLIGRMK